MEVAGSGGLFTQRVLEQVADFTTRARWMGLPRSDTASSWNSRKPTASLMFRRCRSSIPLSSRFYPSTPCKLKVKRGVFISSATNRSATHLQYKPQRPRRNHWTAVLRNGRLRLAAARPSRQAGHIRLR